jgi:alcohol dehydrogenase, propanol-preferring
MRAMVFEKPGQPLKLMDVPIPTPGSGQVLIKINACGICRTDLHVVDGELAEPKLPLIPGHQIVGTVFETGENVIGARVGDRVGVPWLGGSCGKCNFCITGRENLCSEAKYTGYQIDGGFAEFTVADERFIFPIPERYPDIQSAPLLCAGLIGYRAYRFTGDAKKLGLYGFGAAAHLIAQVAIHQGREIFAFTRNGDTAAQDFAKKLGAVWIGGSFDTPPEPLDAAIIFAPVGDLVPAALKAVDKGGIVVLAGIHMSDIPSFSYKLIWGERSIKSVANLTRQNGVDFLKIAPEIPVESEVTLYHLEKTNEALDDLRHGRFNGAAVIVI